MQDREHDYPVRFDTVEHGMRKAGNKGPTDLAVDLREHLSVTPDCVERRIDRRKESFAESPFLLFVVSETRSKIYPNLPPENNRQRHQRRRASAST